MGRTVISTNDAPKAIGPYSQAIRSSGAGDLLFCSGQIALDPGTMELLKGDATAQAEQVFTNLRAVARAAGGELAHVVKLTVFLTDLGDFAAVNAVMASHFAAPYPARSTVQVAALPRGASVEVEAIMVLRS